MKLSIVIPSYNQADFLKQTLASVLGQEFAGELEVVVVDGGSTDGSVALLRGVDDPRVTWTSEADRGQSHAINKGLARVTGDVVTWLNSDDLYLPGALEAVAKAFEANPGAQWLIGRVEIIDEQGRVIRPSITRYKNALLDRYSYRGLLRENFISQMGVFWRRSFGEAVQLGCGVSGVGCGKEGGEHRTSNIEHRTLDESLHYCMDYDLWLRMGRRSEPVILDRVLAQFRLYAGSKSGAVNREQFDEQYRVASRYFDGDRLSRIIHRLHVEKIVWAYRGLRLVGR